MSIPTFAESVNTLTSRVPNLNIPSEKNETGNPSRGLDQFREVSDQLTNKIMTFQLAGRMQDAEQTIVNTIIQAQNGVKEAAANAISKGQQIAASIR